MQRRTATKKLLSPFFKNQKKLQSGQFHRRQYYDREYAEYYSAVRRRKIIFGAAASLLTLYGLFHLEKTPVTNRWRFIFMGEGAEKELGAASFNEILGTEHVLPKYHPDTALVNKIGHRIQRVTGNAAHHLKWEFVVVANDDMINAVCLPGGKVIVFSGLLRVLDTEAEVAAIMSHEIAHALLRHHAERLGLQSFVGLGSVLVQNFLGITIPAPLIDVSLFLPYSRKQELEADLIGLMLLSRACYDPQEAKSAFQKLELGIQQTNADAAIMEQRVLNFLSTHPSFANRIKQFDNYMDIASREQMKFCTNHHSSKIQNWYDEMPKLKV